MVWVEALPAVAVPSSARSGWGRSGHRRAIVVGAIVLIVVLGGGAAAWAAASSGNSGYRTATVVRADIGQSMTVVGTVEPVNDASASFQVGGKVATVTTTVGEQVTAGQSLGTLDTTSLGESVSSAQSTLNSAEAKLVQDETSQTSSTSGAPAASSMPTTTTTTPSTHGGPSTGTQSTIAQDQNTLTQDEAKTAADQQQEAADLAQAQQTCGTATNSTTTTSSTTTTTNPANCEAALAQVSKDQQKVSADQAAVAKDEAALSQALGQGSSGTSGSPTQAPKALSTTPSGSGGGSGSGAGTASGGNSGGGSSASTNTPQQIAADQAAIDTAQANLTVAEQALAESRLTSPISGTIVSVGINVGDTVSANSSTAVIVIIGTQSFEIAATLSSSQVPSVKVGDSAVVQVDGLKGAIPGTVSQVGPVQSGQSGYTFPVVVALPSSATGLFTGSTANIVIATGAVRNVMAVPTSAVQTRGSRSFVEVDSSGASTAKLIKVGMVGDTYTQVLSGLALGQSVVLADYSLPVPSSNTNTFGGFGAGGFGAGGFGGGGAFRIQRISGAGGPTGAFGG